MAFSTGISACMATLLLTILAAPAGWSPSAAPGTAPVAADVSPDRARAWQLFADSTQSGSAQALPAFAGWHTQVEVFARRSAVLASRQVARFPQTPLDAGKSLAHLSDAPVITFVHYNPAASVHIRRHGLHRSSVLERLLASGAADPQFPQLRTVPAFPASAMVAMSAWWPVQTDEVNPVPVWDAPHNASRRGGNTYMDWSRIVALMPHGTSSGSEIVFGGRTFHAVKPARLQAFLHVRLTASDARRLMRDAGSRKAAAIALGRPLRGGDQLLLVGLHLLSLEKRSGLWATFWWHDAPDAGAFAQGRPAGLAGAHGHYLMDVSTDATFPREDDGSPNICFNPWLEARFPDAGAGGGAASNCVNCHSRASYPRPSFLPVRRGAADLADDPAYATGRLRTAMLWSLANADMPTIVSNGQ